MDRLEQSIQKSLNEQDQKVETLTASAQTAILDRIEALEINAAKVAEAEKESAELKTELERVKNTLGWRQRRKLGYQKS